MAITAHHKNAWPMRNQLVVTFFSNWLSVQSEGKARITSPGVGTAKVFTTFQCVNAAQIATTIIQAAKASAHLTVVGSSLRIEKRECTVLSI